MYMIFLENNLQKERDTVINILESVFKKKNVANIEESMIHQLKLASKTSPQLVQTIKVLESKYPWPTSRVVKNTAISIGLAGVGTATYIFDVVTDVLFR